MRKLPTKFSIANILFATALVAIFVALQGQLGWDGTIRLFHFYPWIGIAVFEFIIGVFCISSLLSNIPSAIVEAQKFNCMRDDGTWSKRREKIEEKDLYRLRFDLTQSFILLFVAGNILLAYLHYFVVPLPLLGASVLEPPTYASSTPPVNWERYDAWIGLILLGVAALCFAIGYVAYAYAYSLRQLSSRIQSRARQYGTLSPLTPLDSES